MTGGVGPDKFDYDEMDFGDDVVTGFAAEDELDFDVAIFDMNAFTFSQNGADAVVTYTPNGATITLQNVNSANLSVDGDDIRVFSATGGSTGGTSYDDSIVGGLDDDFDLRRKRRRLPARARRKRYDPWRGERRLS